MLLCINIWLIYADFRKMVKMMFALAYLPNDRIILGYQYIVNSYSVSTNNKVKELFKLVIFFLQIIKYLYLNNILVILKTHG